MPLSDRCRWNELRNEQRFSVSSVFSVLATKRKYSVVKKKVQCVGRRHYEKASVCGGEGGNIWVISVYCYAIVFFRCGVHVPNFQQLPTGHSVIEL